MMVLFPCKLITSWLPWNLNRDEPPFLEQGLDITVDRRNPDRWMKFKGARQRFLGREGTPRLGKCLPNSGLLLGISLIHH